MPVGEDTVGEEHGTSVMVLEAVVKEKAVLEPEAMDVGGVGEKEVFKRQVQN